MEEKRKLIKHGIMIAQIALVCVVVTAIILGIIINHDCQKVQARYEMSLSKGWTLIDADGHESEVSGSIKIGNTEAVTIYTVLPCDLKDRDVLRFRCLFYTVDAYIDGECIYHAGPASIGNIETTIGNIIVLIPLKAEYSEKEIRIVIQPRNYFYDVYVREMAITTVPAFTLESIIHSVPYMMMCALITFISIVALFLGIIFRFVKGENYKKMSSGFIYLEMFGLVSVTWVFSDFHLLGIINNKMVLSGIINYIGFMLCPVMFSGVLKCIFDRKLFFRVMYVVSYVNFVVQMLLFFFGVTDLPDGLVITQVLLIFLVIGMLYFSVLIGMTFTRKNAFLLGVPTISFAVFAVASIVTYVMNGSWMLYVALAMMFYAVAVIVYLLSNFWKNIKSRIEAEQIRKYAYTDNLTGLENRRAYNEYVNELEEKHKEGKLSKNLTAVVFDLNGLKKTNDIFGHVAGDELITAAARCIEVVYAEYGRCFRTGGDEFVAIGFMTDEIYTKKQKELKQLMDGFEGEYVKGASTSVGKAAMYEYPEYSVSELMDKADKLMYEDKQAYYTSELMQGIDKKDAQKNLKLKTLDTFKLSKYTMPIIKQMAEVLPGGFFIYKEDEKREIIFKNRYVLEIYGCKTEEEFSELTGNSFNNMVHPDDFLKVQATIDAQIASPENFGNDNVIYRIIRKDGQVRLVGNHGHVSLSPDYGDIFYVFISDITMHHQ